MRVAFGGAFAGDVCRKAVFALSCSAVLATSAKWRLRADWRPRLAERRHRTGSGHLEVRQSPPGASPDPGGRRPRTKQGKARGSDRAEANRARSILLTLRGWTSARLAEAFGVREDTVCLWRSLFMHGGAAALETRPLPGPEPAKTRAALRVAGPLLSAPVTNRVNWTLARLADEIEARESVTISKSALSKALRKKGAFAFADPATR